jgi:hypothetical protein
MPTTSTPESPDPIVYHVALPVSRKTITFVADLIRRHLTKIGSRWRKLPSGRQALIVLAVLRHDQRAADLAGAYGISRQTITRWTGEVIALLAAKHPRLDRTLSKIAKAGGEVVLLDGTLARTRRRTGRENRKNYNGKHKAHGLNFQIISDLNGNGEWISPAKPGRTADVTAAGHHKIVQHLRAAGLGGIADLGYLGLDDDPDDPVIITGYRRGHGKQLTDAQKAANELVSRERAAVEHAIGDIKNWRILTKLRTTKNPTQLLRAILVLTRMEITR